MNIFSSVVTILILNFTHTLAHTLMHACTHRMYVLVKNIYSKILYNNLEFERGGIYIREGPINSIISLIGTDMISSLLFVF